MRRVVVIVVTIAGATPVGDRSTRVLLITQPHSTKHSAHNNAQFENLQTFSDFERIFERLLLALVR
jgi:hypothetical protein